MDLFVRKKLKNRHKMSSYYLNSESYLLSIYINNEQGFHYNKCNCRLYNDTLNIVNCVCPYKNRKCCECLMNLLNTVTYILRDNKCSLSLPQQKRIHEHHLMFYSVAVIVIPESYDSIDEQPLTPVSIREKHTRFQKVCYSMQKPFKSIVET